MSLLEIKNLHVKVDNNEILKGINLTVNPGEVHSIMGPNGSGKSTLAQVLARRESYDVTEGQVLFDGKDLLEMKAEDAPAKASSWRSNIRSRFPASATRTFCAPPSTPCASITARTKWTPWTSCPCSARS